MNQNNETVGANAVDLLSSHLMRGEHGLPSPQKSSKSKANGSKETLSTQKFSFPTNHLPHESSQIRPAIPPPPQPYPFSSPFLAAHPCCRRGPQLGWIPIQTIPAETSTFLDLTRWLSPGPAATVQINPPPSLSAQLDPSSLQFKIQTQPDLQGLIDLPIQITPKKGSPFQEFLLSRSSPLHPPLHLHR